MPHKRRGYRIHTHVPVLYSIESPRSTDDYVEYPIGQIVTTSGHVEHAMGLFAAKDEAGNWYTFRPEDAKIRTYDDNGNVTASGLTPGSVLDRPW